METINSLKNELAETIRLYHQKGWSPATSTNYSFRLESDPNTIYVSCSGIDKSRFSANDFMEVDLLGKPKLGYENIRPSAETLIHTTLYQLFPQINFILHSHSSFSVIQSIIKHLSIELEGYEILKGYEGIKTHEAAVQLPIFDNTQNMVEFSELLKRERSRLTVPAFLMRKHGTYAWGKTLFEAKRHLETTEYLLEVETILNQKKNFR